MEILSSPNLIAGLLALVAGLFAYAFLVPRNLDKFAPNVDPQNKDARLLNLLTKVGSELYSSLPSSNFRKNKRPQIETLLQKSGNPWNLQANEFFFIQFVTAFIGLLVGFASWFSLTALKVSIPLLGILAFTVTIGFLIPRLKYNEQAKARDIDFKRQLPEALDLIIISLSGGSTFTQALRDSLPNMQEGVLKNEFKSIMNSINTGRTLNEALGQFGDRAPNDSIKTFITAVREANELNVPLVEVLQSRAEASRQEFFALIHARTAQLSSKMMAVLTPTLIPALLIIVLLPALASVLNTLGR